MAKGTKTVGDKPSTDLASQIAKSIKNRARPKKLGHAVEDLPEEKLAVVEGLISLIHEGTIPVPGRAVLYEEVGKVVDLGDSVTEYALHAYMQRRLKELRSEDGE